MKKVVIFDVMGVIFKVGDDTNDLLVPYIRNLKPSITAEYINQVYLEASLGKITSREFWRRMGFDGDHESIEKDYLDNCLTLDENLIAAAEELKADYDLAVLSNDLSEWSAYLRRKYGLDRLFREIVISGDVGLRKPDINIYKLLLSRLNTPPGDCVFIDDRYKNLKPAAELGMKTIRFDREALEKTFEPDAEIRSFVGLKEVADGIFRR
jgi:putative hydrolase of the HAD superfamily